MHKFEVTFREVVVSVVIVILMIAVGFPITEKIYNNATENNEKYFKSLKINDDENMFEYALNTNIGNTLAYGKFKANEPVSDKMIKGKYFAIERIQENYVMKTRTVTYTSNGKTKTRTETYWTWEEVDRVQANTKTFNFLGKDFSYSKARFSNYREFDTVRDGNTRYIFEVIPYEFKGTLFSKVIENTITDSSVYAEKDLKQVIELKKNDAGFKVKCFWFIWAGIIILVIVGFVALDNRYLNGK